MKPTKIDPKNFFESLSACLPMNNLYVQFNAFIEGILNVVDGFETTDNTKDDILRFLKLNLEHKIQFDIMIEGNVENIGYTVLLTLMGISREQMKNIIIPFHSYFFIEGAKATVSKVFKDPKLLLKLVDLLYEGKNNSELSEILSGDTITLNRFSLCDLDSFNDLIKNKLILKRLVEDTYKSRMQNKKGYSTETGILAGIVDSLGIPHEAGEVPALEKYFPRDENDEEKARNPRIDLVIPSKENPKILIESTYNLTTASGQTKKMDANDSLFRAIKKYREETKREIIFINFVDGAGWKSRGYPDVSRLVNSCDYAINYKNLELLKQVLIHYFGIEEK